MNKRTPSFRTAVALGLLALAWLVSLPARADVNIVAPNDYQVFQRSPEDSGAVPVLVQDTAGRQVRARLTVADPHFRGADTDWTALSPTRGGYAGTLYAAAGGWYVLHVESAGDGGSVTTDSVAHVGIGEVFIVAGQSNAASFGGTPQSAQDPRVVVTDGRTWRPAVDPISASHGEGNGSPWPIVGDMLAKSLQVPVSFADIAVGGSHTSQWLPETHDLYPGLLRLARSFGRHGVRCVLWHQGEADALGVTPHGKPVPEPYAGNEPEDVYSRMATIINSLDQDLDWKLPWMVAQAAWGPNPAVYHPDIEAQVRAGQALLWKRGVALPGPLTDDLTGPPWRSGLKGRGIHFSDIGLHVHAERWYTHLMAEVFAPRAVSRRGEYLRSAADIRPSAGKS